MKYSKLIVHSVLLLTVPSIALYPQADLPVITVQNHETVQEPQTNSLWSYDYVLNLIDDLENGTLEKRYSEADLERMNHFLANLAAQGVLPDEIEEESVLKNDIQELLHQESHPEYYYSFNQGNDYIIGSSVFYNQGEIFLCKSWIHKKWDQTKIFVKKHKKAIIIGAAVVIAAATVIGIVAAASAASAAAAAAAASDNGKYSEDEDDDEQASASPIPSTDTPVMTNETPVLQSTIEEQIFSFKETIAKEHFFQPSSNGESSLEENGRIVGSLFGHDSFKNLTRQLSDYPELAEELQNIELRKHFLLPEGASDTPLDFGHQEIDRQFSTDYASLYSNPNSNADFNTLSYQLRGERALAFGHLNQAVRDLGKAIELDPKSPLPYLERGVAHFALGQYDRSMEDYRQFTSQFAQTPTYPLSVSKFSLGFAKGLPKGVYDSGHGLLLFLGDFVTDPIHTAGQIFDSFSTLANLVRNDEWGIIGETLAPEIHQLVTQWDTIPSDKRGELAGYAVGKYGADILAPGALVKIASKSVKSAQVLASVCKNLQIAQETLVLETAAGIGNSAKIGEVVRAGQKTAFFAEELGFTAREIGQLKQAGKLEATIDNAFETLIKKSPSEAYIAAKNGGKHAPLIKLYSGKPAKEIQKGVKSLEKQITVHQDKIANPSKYCPDWDTMDPRRQEALINKRWPTEIQCYTEERDILQSILDQVIEN